MASNLSPEYINYIRRKSLEARQDYSGEMGKQGMSQQGISQIMGRDINPNIVSIEQAPIYKSLQEIPAKDQINMYNKYIESRLPATQEDILQQNKRSDLINNIRDISSDQLGSPTDIELRKQQKLGLLKGDWSIG